MEVRCRRRSAAFAFPVGYKCSEEEQKLDD